MTNIFGEPVNDSQKMYLPVALLRGSCFNYARSYYYLSEENFLCILRLRHITGKV